MIAEQLKMSNLTCTDGALLQLPFTRAVVSSIIRALGVVNLLAICNYKTWICKGIAEGIRCSHIVLIDVVC